VLEAKLVAGGIVFSIATEFIENEDENVSKQDCERVLKELPQMHIKMAMI
jgi:hypothetical protein